MRRIPVGYQALIELFQLEVLPHYRLSYILLAGGKPKTILTAGQEIHEYSKSYALSDSDNAFSQIEFALKHDGLNLEILSLLFRKLSQEALCTWIQERPTGKYTRMVWFLYEFLMNEKLQLTDCKRLKYLDLLDPKKYFTAERRKSHRHGINNNLLGDRRFCPIIRRTASLEKYIDEKLDKKVKEIVQHYDPVVIARANNYLLTKETMSSYEIEQEKPNQERMTRFINLLKRVNTIKKLTKKLLIECQNTIVDPRFADADYRHTQNYVGENINMYRQKIHFISPKPNDLPDLMQGLLNSLSIMETSNCHPVIIASAISFGFVFLHPFEDGNGRLHRFLIHYVLDKNEFSPEKIIFPVSAVMLKNLAEYDKVLESYSEPLMEKIKDYELNDEGLLKTHQETKNYYQYVDFTKTSEYLFSCIDETISLHLKKELEFLVNYDKTKIAMQEIVDMPDRLIDLFIRFLLQNRGELSANKYKRYFSFLTESELHDLKKLVTNNMIR